MMNITARNSQQALASFLQLMHSEADLDQKGVLRLTEPITFVFEEPRERFIFWPGFRRNPAQEFHTALQSIAQTESSLPQAAEAILADDSHFLFSTPQLVVQAKLTKAGKVDMYAIVSERNPFTGAFGQLAMQLTVLQELLCNEVKKNMGSFTIQHMGVEMHSAVVGQLLKASFDSPVADPYENGDVKARKIDSPVEIKMILEEGDKAMGYKSKWVRGVLLPLLKTGTFEDLDDIAKQIKKVKASDVRRSMEEWLLAVRESMAMQEAAKAAGQGEGAPNLKVVE